NWATEVIKSEIIDNSVRCVASSRRINHRGDILNTPTITIECASPFPDVLLLTAYHWKAQTKTTNGPHYETFPDVDVKELVSNFDTRPHVFNIDIKSHGVSNPANPSSAHDQLLTQLGWRSVGYVKRGTTAGHPNTTLDDPDPGERWMTLQLQLSVGERIYGLGERFGPFIKNGQTVDMWNEDGGTSSELAYKNVPFYLSSRGYGIWIPCAGRVSFEVQSERTTRVNISVPFESISAYIIHGPTPSAILGRYTLITGRPALPPPWTFSLFLSTSFTTNYSEATVDEFLSGMRERDIPVGVFHFDCFWMKGFQWCDFEFDADFFPDTRGQLARLHERGYKANPVCVWINPYIAQESKLFDEGAQHGYFIKKRDGSIWQYDEWQAGMAFVDFTNPHAWTWYQSKLRELMELGVDCFKTDFGERIPTGNTVFYDGSDPDKMHNYYAFLYNKCVFEVSQKVKGKNQAIVFARSATSGGQRFPVHWGGDPMSTFEAMAETLRGGLSLGLCGFGFWAHDIGGFEGSPDPALYKRWFAFGSMSSHSRLHGSGSFRVPWLIDPSGEADKVLKYFINLKLSLMPYLYHTAIQTHKTGVPLMRAMLVEFPEDPIAWTLDTQYMLGPNLLVAPVFSNEGVVQYYVPPGRWYGLVDGRIRVGPGYVTETHDFMSMPVLLRPGSVVAMGRETGGSSVYDYTSAVRILVNPTPGMQVDVQIPDSRNPGAIAAVVEVTNVQAEIKHGAFGSWVVDAVQENVDGSLTRYTSSTDSNRISF
ncbi:alpha-xylosidase, partial [Fistulina hepatica ATCC 64428]